MNGCLPMMNSRFFLPYLFLPALTCLMTSCGSVRHFQHAKVPAPEGKTLSPLTLRVGETRKMVKHTFGLLSIGGGYVQGVSVENSSLVRIDYGKNRQVITGEVFDPYVYITGLKPGKTRAAYDNRLSSSYHFGQENEASSLRLTFVIEVVE